MGSRRLALLVACSLPASAWAGMPMVTLSDAAGMRFKTISFFLLLIALATLILRWLWNGAARELPRLPRLSYRAALGLVALWGAVFVLVLTMISGARELMTPGAWTKEGATYRLAQGEDPLVVARRQRLELLRAVLWSWAAEHGGALPPHDLVPAIPATAWQTLAPGGLRYVYVPGGRVDQGSRPVAYEPGVYGRQRFVLFSDGRIERHPWSAISEALEPGDG